MRYLIVALILTLVPLSATASETQTAIEFAQTHFRAAKNPVYGLFRRKKPLIERHGAVTVLKMQSCVAPSESMAFRDLPSRLTQFCQESGGTDLLDQSGRNLCELESNDGPGLWFSAQLNQLGSCGPAGVSSAQSLELVLYELDIDQVGTVSADVDWMSLGFKPARARAFKQRSEAAAKQATEQFRVENQEPAIKTKGSQVCQPKKAGGEFVGFVEDVSGNRIKVLVAAYYYDSLKIGTRDTSFTQQYVWSNFEEWRLC